MNADRKVLVTGAGGGIGSAVVRSLIDQGAAVLATDRDDAALTRLVDDLQDKPLFTTTADVRATQTAELLAAAAQDLMGGLDGLVLNAGIEHRARLADTTDEDWERVLDVNLSSCFRLLRATWPLLRAQDSAAVVGVSSIAVTGFAQQMAYDASKAGLQTLMRSTAVELGPNVRANAVCPGFIATPMLEQSGLSELAEKVARGIPAARVGAPGEVAEAVTWLLSHRSSYVTGQTLFVDGGMVRS